MQMPGRAAQRCGSGEGVCHEAGARGEDRLFRRDSRRIDDQCYVNFRPPVSSCWRPTIDVERASSCAKCGRRGTDSPVVGARPLILETLWRRKQQFAPLIFGISSYDLIVERGAVCVDSTANGVAATAAQCCRIAQLMSRLRLD